MTIFSEKNVSLDYMKVFQILLSSVCDCFVCLTIFNIKRRKENNNICFSYTFVFSQGNERWKPSHVTKQQQRILYDEMTSNKRDITKH